MTTIRRASVLVVCLLWSGYVLAGGFCVQCGEKLRDEVKFCAECGHKVGAPLKQPAPVKAETPKPAPEYESVQEADAFYELAEEKRTSLGARILPHLKKRRYEEALELYRSILEKWPNSDKCEKAAYRIGQIYESIAYKDWNQSIRYYRMVLAINPQTTLDARLAVARVTRDGIQDYAGAAALYQECIKKARVQDEKETAARELADLRERMEESRRELEAS